MERETEGVMKTINEGGSAFPMPDTEGYNVNTMGMTLRDYFAAAALQGMTAHPITGEQSTCKVAAWSYQLADAMIAERNKEQ